MSLDVFLTFDRTCRPAVEFYASVFGLDVPKMMTYGDMPPDPNFTVTDDVKNLVCYTSLSIDGHNMMFCDNDPSMPFTAGNNFSLTYSSKNAEDIKHVFAAIGAGGEVVMPLETTFWSDLFGMVTDKFGVSWQVSLDSGKY